MNKKIFTLLLAFFFVATSAFAQSAGVGLEGETSMPESKRTNLYHLVGTAKSTVANDSMLLVVDKDGILRLTDKIDVLGESLWCVNVTAPEALGQNPTFDFSNKAYGTNLMVNVEDTALAAGLNISTGVLGGWKFSPVYENNLEDGYFATYYTADSVLVLAMAADSTVRVKAFAANDVPPAATNADSVIYFSVRKPAPKVLTAEDFNTLLGTTDKGYQTLEFNKDVTGEDVTNPMAVGLMAEDVPGSTNGYVRLFKKAKNGKDSAYLYVDTAYINNYGTKFLDFAYTDTKKQADTTKIPEHYTFKLIYNIFNDSLAIQVGAVRYNKENNPYWINAWKTDSTASSTNPVVAAGDSALVILQDLPASVRVLTIGTAKANTKISLGIGECASVKPGFTSIDEDLYVIKNTKGQYLVMPIYTDTVSGPKWVTVEKNIDPMRQPAYQWFVEKTRTSDENNNSPIKILNREFKDKEAEIPSVQLRTVEAAKDGVQVGTTGGYVLPNEKSFIKVSETLRKDSLLGYKMVAEETAKVTLYDFKYLHEFNMNTYLTVTDTDSALFVAEKGKVPFRITPLTFAQYGRTSKKVKDAVQLWRATYHFTVEDSQSKQNGKSIVANTENRYTVSKYYNVERGDSSVATFYLKTNNTLDETGEDYHAMLDLAYWYNADGGRVKGGIDDNSVFLKTQAHKETRTSAFLVSPIEVPLYRRFNTALENQEGSDAPLTLEFFRMNESQDKLYEDAWSKYSTVNGDGKKPSMGINFLGVKNSNSYPAVTEGEGKFSYSIYVDTAFVRRPATPLSGIETPKPQYLLAVGVDIVAPGKLCPYDPEHNTQAWRDQYNKGLPCAHAVESEGYTFGRYLINAEDSIKKAKGAYLWDKDWTRLAFVDAIHKGDSLYILNNVYNKNNADFAKMIADKDFANNIVPLNNNHHKDVVFQFRLIDLEDAEKNFYIESENEYLNNDGDKNSHTVAVGTMIAPAKGGWVKIHNGVPVISRGNAIDAMADAERFNVNTTEEKPVANEEINAGSEVTVTAINGAVVINNALGKSVTISNILGKTLTNTVIKSDEATISVPAGIVVVAVEGEEAVKVIVK